MPPPHIHYDGIIIVDVQDRFFNHYYKNERDQLVSAVEQLLLHGASRDIPVANCVHMRGGEVVATVAQALAKVPRHRHFFKKVPDGFDDPALDPWLHSHGANALCFAGIEASQCVFTTATSAAKREFLPLSADQLLGNLPYMTRFRDRALAEYKCKEVYERGAGFFWNYKELLK